MEEKDLAKEQVRELVEKSRVAQEKFESFTQEQVDVIVKEIGKTVFDNAEELARMAVDETRMGVYEDKVLKNQGKSRGIWSDLNGVKSVGIIGRDEKTGIVRVAKPIGVVAAVTPTTNPIVTPMCNSMFALKGRNAIIIAPHPRSKNCSSKTVDLVNEAIKKYDAPENLIQVIREPSIPVTIELMSQADVVVATGGAAMVKSAYSSGKPALGVGPGNVQVIIDKDADFDDAAEKVINGRKFDNGIICSGEQSVIAPDDKYEDVLAAFEAKGAFIVRNDEDKKKFRGAIFTDGHMNPDAVGQSVEFIAKLAGVEVPEDRKIILIEGDGYGTEDLLCKEKMCPAMVALKYDTFDDALHIAQSNLNVEGKGHTCAIHSNNKENVEKAGLYLTISRLVVNQPCSSSAGGAITNGFMVTTTLGCGSWGNNSISENLNFTHLINVSQIGYNVENKERIAKFGFDK